MEFTPENTEGSMAKASRHRIGRVYAPTPQWSGPTAREVVAGELLRRRLQVAEPLWSGDELYLVHRDAGAGILALRLPVRPVQWVGSGGYVVPVSGIVRDDLDDPGASFAVYAPTPNRMWLFLGADSIRGAYEAQRAAIPSIAEATLPLEQLSPDASLTIFVDVSREYGSGLHASALLDRTTRRDLVAEVAALSAASADRERRIRRYASVFPCPSR
jgi:hypothetical protein